MDAAFGLVQTSPTTGTIICGVSHSGGAGPASDRAKTIVEKWVPRQPVLFKCCIDILRAPVGERVDLGPTVE
jgi:hypothetical protein